MKAAEFEQLKLNVLNHLGEQLPANLTYHNAGHTEDVLEQAELIAKKEGITEEEDLMALRIAALFHDNGFLLGYTDHEIKSCCIMKEQMKGKTTEAQIEKICGLIMATKIPQSPKTHLEEIICDADLDYLGRDDFEPVSDSLREEFLAHGVVQNDREWQEKQIKFFEQHRYFTVTSNNLRNAAKQERLRTLREVYSSQYGI